MNDICKTMVSPIFGAIRIAGTEEKPLFCLSDVCRALDIKNPSDCKSRLSREGGSYRRGGLPNDKSVRNNNITEGNAHLH